MRTTEPRRAVLVMVPARVAERLDRMADQRSCRPGDLVAELVIRAMRIDPKPSESGTT